MVFLNNKSFNYLLLGLNTLFLIYYVMLAIYTRPHYDDLHFLWKMREMSISEYVSDMYFSRSGRFVAYALNGIIFSTINYIQLYWIFPVFFWFVGVTLSVFGVLKLTKQKFTFENVSVIVLIYNVFILTNIDFAVFNWLCALSYYILAPAMLTLFALLISKGSDIKIISTIIVFSVFLGGGQEAFTPIVLALILAIVINELYKNKFSLTITFRSVIVKKSAVSIVILSAMLLIVVLAPGNYKRLEMDEFSRPETLAGYMIGFSKAISMFIYFFAFYLPYYLILALVVYRIFQVNVVPKLFVINRYFILSLIIYFFYLMFSVFPSVYLWGDFGIQRNYTHLVFVSILFLIYWSLLVFTRYKFFTSSLLTRASDTGVIFLIIVMLFNLYSDSKSASQYAYAVDQRLELVKKHNTKVKPDNLVVTPLPIPYTVDVKFIVFKLIGEKSNKQPVLFYISDTDTVANEYAMHFRKYYNLNFEIVLDNE